MVFIPTGTEGVKAKTVTEGDPTGKEKTLHVDADSLASAKSKLSQGLEPGQEIGQTKTATYKGKSMELGEGGRSQMMRDRITMDLVNKGMSFEQAQVQAKTQATANGTKKYGAEQMAAWGKAKSTFKS